MDIRGIEVTNQLRSAIRAKLLELGVRYDEELPDYILVMVVNKKTRQQMYEDLCLFLEESTSPFVDWLHDQVLKKLQKVTVAKKKSSRELVPTVIVKQEEERKKKKSCPTSFLEDQTADASDKSLDKAAKVTKLPKKTEKPTKSHATGQNTETDVTHSPQNPPKRSSNVDSKNSSLPNVHTGSSSQDQNTVEATSLRKTTEKTNHLKNTSSIVEHLSKSSIDAQISVKMSEISSKNSKKISNADQQENISNKVEISSATVKPPAEDEFDEESDEESKKKVKSSVNKPRITSVVTVKNRLEFPTVRNKFNVQERRPGFEGRYRKTFRDGDKHDFEGIRRNDISSGRNTRSEEYFRRNVGKNHDFEARIHESDRSVDIKSRLGNIREDKVNKAVESKDKSALTTRVKSTERLSNSIKDRLGSGNSIKTRENPLHRKTELLEEQKNLKFADKDRSMLTSNSSIKNRLGPVKNIFKSPKVTRRPNVPNKLLASSEDEDCLNLGADDDTDDDARSAVAIGPVKSRIIAVKRSAPDKSEWKRPKLAKEVEANDVTGKDEEDDEGIAGDGKIASKVIVTPRPLKPLQPLQKRATQSLLFRAVAEANQSVVTQKNPEPVLMEKTTAPKRPTPSGMREGQNLSVRLNSTKRLVMEKIQVELTTGEADIENPEPYVPQRVTEEHMGVVMSLFQRSNDSQKFLVTLNGYNNNVSKEKGASDEDEHLDMEVDEDEDFLNTTVTSEDYATSKAALNGFELIDVVPVESVEKMRIEDQSSENQQVNDTQVTKDSPKKKRKLSPIVYNRSRSSSPVNTRPTKPPSISLKHVEKQTALETTAPGSIDKSREKCRYWPNCTLGIKCTYYHPAVLCSLFPACKFGDKCLYKHPKCKFGLSCTKLGCVYTHPPRQCKYHPYCANPSCTYTHPLPQVQPVEVVSNRAKFTWRKHE
ncbi:zinc finger CCCH domain-containing protein 14 [Athalia rosae]|uniref:zinc finger CCCH domain-containing protein 14 n=1 Tax=Athalia rosae TaxID=37344 RepID=UPI002033C101|nr:zinc finger CCCH domain-containing protein 14 [Athalia rosae]